jgi:hypothetical protein
MYSMVEEIVESSGTPYFTFHDIDENKPTGSIKIRVETIAYFLGRYQDEMREKAEMEQRIQEAVRAYTEALRRGESPPSIDEFMPQRRTGVVIPLGIAMSGGSAREGGSCGSGGCGDGCGDSCGTGGGCGTSAGGCGTSAGGCGSGGCGSSCGTPVPIGRFDIADDMLLPVLSAPGREPVSVAAKSDEFYVPLPVLG